MSILVISDIRRNRDITMTVCAASEKHVEPPALCPYDVGPLTWGPSDRVADPERNLRALEEYPDAQLFRVKTEMKRLAEQRLVELSHVDGGLAGETL